MTLLAFAALSLAQAATQEPTSPPKTGTLTVSTGLVPAERALAELSKASGIALRTTPATANLPLLVRVKEADSRVILDRIAEILGAEWKQDGDAFVLSSDSSFQRKLARTPDAPRVARLDAKLVQLDADTAALKFDEAFAGKVRKDGEKMMASMMKSMTEGATEFDPTAIFSSSLMTQSPGSQAINALLHKLGAAKLATLVPGERVVYALNPTRMQGPLPPGARAIVGQFVQNTAAYTQSMKNTASGEPFDLFSMMGGMGGKSTGKGPVANAHLELWVSDGTLTASLTVFDAEGQSLGQGFSFVDVTGPKPTVVPGGSPLVVSELGREWGGKFSAALASTPSMRNGPLAYASMFGGGGAARSEALSKPMTPALRAFLADPVANSLAGPIFDPIAAAIPGDLVATVPDSALGVVSGIVADPEMTTTRAVAAIETAPQLSITKDGTLTVIGASTAARLHREFADRSALRSLIAAIARTGYLRLDDAAKYALAQREAAGASNVASPIVTMLQGKMPFAFAGDPLTAEFETLRIYGSLNDAQRASLTAGRGVPYTALSGDAADALERLLFDSPVGPMPTMDDEDAEESEGDPTEVMSMFAGMNTRGAERTVRFADGVPRDGFFTMTTSGDDTYRMTDSATGATMFGDASTLGFLRGAKDLPFFKSFAPSGNYDRFTPAKSRDLNFKFVFGPKLAASHSLQDYEVSSTESLTYDRLPKEFRDAVEAASTAAAAMKAPPAKIKP